MRKGSKNQPFWTPPRVEKHGPHRRFTDFRKKSPFLQERQTFVFSQVLQLFEHFWQAPQRGGFCESNFFSQKPIPSINFK